MLMVRLLSLMAQKQQYESEKMSVTTVLYSRPKLMTLIMETMPKSNTCWTVDICELRIDKFTDHVSVFGKINRDLQDHYKVKV